MKTSKTAQTGNIETRLLQDRMTTSRKVGDADLRDVTGNPRPEKKPRLGEEGKIRGGARNKKKRKLQKLSTRRAPTKGEDRRRAEDPGREEGSIRTW